MNENRTSVKKVLIEIICPFHHLRSELESDVYDKKVALTR